jgi:hypothetical protein
VAREAGIKLKEHPVLRKLGGHPGLIFRATQLMAIKKLDELPPIIDEWQKRPPPPPPSAPAAPITPGPTPFVPEEPPEPSFKSIIDKLVAIEDQALWLQKFGEKLKVTWGEFKPFLEDHFVYNAQVAYRKLSEQDLEIIRGVIEQKSEKNHVSLAAYGKLWPWIKELERCVLRVRSEWCQDRPTLIHGVLGREKSQDLLQPYPVGTFLLRWSENQSGSLVVSYVSDIRGDEKKFHHVLITIGENLSLKTDAGVLGFRTLAEVIAACKPLSALYPGVAKAAAFPITEVDDGPM